MVNKVTSVSLQETAPVRGRAANEKTAPVEKITAAVSEIFGDVEVWYENKFQPWLQRSWKWIVGISVPIIATIAGIVLTVCFVRKSERDEAKVSEVKVKSNTAKNVEFKNSSPPKVEASKEENSKEEQIPFEKKVPGKLSPSQLEFAANLEFLLFGVAKPKIKIVEKETSIQESDAWIKMLKSKPKGPLKKPRTKFAGH